MAAGVIVALALWGGICWVLRGGAFGALCRRLLGVEPGTTITRVATMGMLAFPFGWVLTPQIAIALWASCYLASTIGYFGGAMGLERPGRDHALMALWGMCVAAVASLPLWVDDLWSGFGAFPPAALLAAASGALAAPAYAISKAFGRRFGTDWTQRAEFTEGMALVMSLALAAEGYLWKA
jgi:hypothetical protein